MRRNGWRDGSHLSPSPERRALLRGVRAASGRRHRLGGGDAVRRMLFADCHAWLADNLLERGDRMSMAASLELRPPFLDHQLVELAFSLPFEREAPTRSHKMGREGSGSVAPSGGNRRPKEGGIPSAHRHLAARPNARHGFDRLLASDSFVADCSSIARWSDDCSRRTSRVPETRTSESGHCYALRSGTNSSVVGGTGDRLATIANRLNSPVRHELNRPRRHPSWV